MTQVPPVAAPTAAVPPSPGGARRRRLDLHDPFTRWTGVGMLLALALRVAWVAYVGHHAPVGLYDPARYIGYAHEIAKGKGYVEPYTGQPTSYYPPGYPWFVGILAWIQEHGPFGSFLPLFVGYVQAVLGAATAGLAGFVARRLVSVRAGIVATFVLAVYPNLVFHTGAILSETLYDFLFLAFLAVILARPWDERLGRWRIAGATALFGAAILVRPISLPVLPFLVVCWWLAVRDWRVVLRWTLVAAVVLVACLTPWTVRNEIRMHAFVPLSTNTGDNLCIGHHPGADGAFQAATWCDTGQGVQFGTKSELRNDSIKTHRALTYLSHHLGGEPRLVWERAHAMFDADHDGVIAVESYRLDWWIPRRTEQRLFDLADGVYAVVALVGVVGLVRLGASRRADRVFLVFATLVTAAVPLAFFGDARFKVPVMPLLCIAAAAAVTMPWREPAATVAPSPSAGDVVAAPPDGPGPAPDGVPGP